MRASDMAKERVEDATKLYSEGDAVEAKFIGIDRKSRVISLSIRAKEDDELAEALEEYQNASSGTTSLGDLLKEQMGKGGD